MSMVEPSDVDRPGTSDVDGFPQTILVLVPRFVVVRTMVLTLEGTVPHPSIVEQCQPLLIQRISRITPSVDASRGTA